MKLSINYNKQKIFLEIYDLHFKLIDNDYYWDFDTIRKRLSNKIKYLAYITAKRKYENRKVYFFYIVLLYLLYLFQILFHDHMCFLIFPLFYIYQL